MNKSKIDTLENEILGLERALEEYNIYGMTLTDLDHVRYLQSEIQYKNELLLKYKDL